MKEIPSTNFEELCKHPDLKQQILDEIAQKAKENQLSGLERIKKVFVTDYAFTVENQMMTPTFKIKRGNAKKVYEKEIEEMYATPLE